MLPYNSYFSFKRQVRYIYNGKLSCSVDKLIIFYVSNIHLNVSKRNSWRGVWVTNLTCDCKGHTDTVTRAVVNRLWHGEVFFFLLSRSQGQNWRVSDSVLCWCDRSSCLGFYGLEGGAGEQISRKYWQGTNLEYVICIESAIFKLQINKH